MAKQSQLRKRSFHSANVVVIGLGRFGSSRALELVNSGHQVLGIDYDEKLVQAMQAFGQTYNLLSKRLRRMPPGYVQETRERITRAKRMAVWSLFISEEQTPA